MWLEACPGDIVISDNYNGIRCVQGKPGVSSYSYYIIETVLFHDQWLSEHDVYQRRAYVHSMKFSENSSESSFYFRSPNYDVTWYKL